MRDRFIELHRVSFCYKTKNEVLLDINNSDLIPKTNIIFMKEVNDLILGHILECYQNRLISEK